MGWFMRSCNPENLARLYEMDLQVAEFEGNRKFVFA